MKAYVVIVLVLAGAAGVAHAGTQRTWRVIEYAAAAARDVARATPRVGQVSDPDPEMRAAMEAARTDINQFWRLFDDPSRGERGFAVKIGVTNSKGTRYSWLEQLLRADGSITGVMSEKPLLNMGREPRRVRIDPDTVVDWLYERDGKVHGYYTLRCSMKTMTPSERERAKRFLAERVEPERSVP